MEDASGRPNAEEHSPRRRRSFVFGAMLIAAGILLLANHPWFKISLLAASARSASKTYEEAVGARWCMEAPMIPTLYVFIEKPPEYKMSTVLSNAAYTIIHTSCAIFV
jgi:hypothetical protein